MKTIFQFSLLVVAVLAVFAAAQSEPQKVLKDVYANHFRVGNILNSNWDGTGGTVNNITKTLK